MQVTCDVESGLRYLLRIEVITGIEADSPFIGLSLIHIYDNEYEIKLSNRWEITFDSKMRVIDIDD